MALLSPALRRHGAVYMVDPLYRIAWLVLPLAVAVSFIARLLLPQPATSPPAGVVSSTRAADAPLRFASLDTLYARARAADPSAENALRQRANEGWPVAQTLMGNLYDPMLNKAGANAARTREATEWYRKAALQGLPVAESNLGILLAHPFFGIASDYAEAKRWFEKVAPINIVATRELGLMYRDGHGVAADPAKATGLLRTAAERGDIAAENMLGETYEKGIGGVTPDPQEAVRMFRLAASQNNAFGERKLAEHLEKGEGVAPDPAEAKVWYARAADAGDRDAANRMRRIDPAAEFLSPKWGATRQVVDIPPGDDAQAERARCLALRTRDPPNRMAVDLPASFDEQKKQSAMLVLHAPRDPRVRYARAAALYDDDHSDIAKVDLECAVDDQPTWFRYPQTQAYILALLARIDTQQGDTAAAEATIAPVCASRSAGARKLDSDIGLCR